MKPTEQIARETAATVYFHMRNHDDDKAEEVILAAITEATVAAVAVQQVNAAATIEGQRITHAREIKAFEAEIKRLKEFQAVCHCGSPVLSHGIGDGHAPVEATEECPYLTERNKLLRFYDEIVADIGHDRILKEYHDRGEQIEAADKEIERLRRRVFELEEREIHIPTKAENEDEITAFRCAYIDRGERLGLVQAERDALRAEVERLKTMTDIDEAMETIDQLRAEVAKLVTERDGLRIERDDAREELATARVDEERLAKALDDATTSLCTLAQQSGRTEELRELSQIRGYAFSRYCDALARKPKAVDCKEESP